MTGNRSLDEFLGGEEPDEPSADPGGAAAQPSGSAPGEAAPVAERSAESATTEPAGEAVSTPGSSGAATADAEPSDDDPSDTGAVEPLAETYAWSPDGGECASCGGPADTRWRDGDELVCGDCKAW